MHCALVLWKQPSFKQTSETVSASSNSVESRESVSSRQLGWQQKMPDAHTSCRLCRIMLMMIRDKETKEVGVISDTESVAGYDRAQHLWPWTKGSGKQALLKQWNLTEDTLTGHHWCRQCSRHMTTVISQRNDCWTLSMRVVYNYRSVIHVPRHTTGIIRHFMLYMWTKFCMSNILPFCITTIT